MSQTTITPAERIRELSAINADVPAMLSSAGKAVSALTNRLDKGSNGTSDVEKNKPSVLAHKQIFTDAAKAYVVTLQAVCARLRRQVVALEEAGVIAAEVSMRRTPEDMMKQMNGSGSDDDAASRQATSLTTQRQEKSDDDSRITNGGLGNLDVGLLNSRGNSVGVQKEAELIAEARHLLSSQLQREETRGKSPQQEVADEHMEEA